MIFFKPKIAIVLMAIAISHPVLGFKNEIIYTEMGMEEFDNGKSNSVVGIWKFECTSHQSCKLTQIAFFCGKGDSENVRPMSEFYSSELGTIQKLKIDGNPKIISFQFRQPAGPLMTCEIQMNKSRPTNVETASCTGSDKWSGGTPYTRKNKLVKNGPILLKEFCKKEIEIP